MQGGKLTKEAVKQEVFRYVEKSYQERKKDNEPVLGQATENPSVEKSVKNGIGHVDQPNGNPVNAAAFRSHAGEQPVSRIPIEAEKQIQGLEGVLNA